MGIMSYYGLLWVTMGYYETHLNPSELILTKRTTLISCQKGSGLASIKRKPGWDILDVFPIRALD